MSFPKLRITGGPHGHQTKVFLDDVEMKGLTKLVLRVDARNVATLYTRQIVSVDVDYTAGEYIGEKVPPLCGCGHQPHPGLVCGWPTITTTETAYLRTNCECEG